jgi:hypothetical protein
MTRQIEEPQDNEEEIVARYEHLYEKKQTILKWEKNQFGPPEEEEGEGEGESEEGEGEEETEGGDE